MMGDPERCGWCSLRNGLKETIMTRRSTVFARRVGSAIASPRLRVAPTVDAPVAAEHSVEPVAPGMRVAATGRA